MSSRLEGTLMVGLGARNLRKKDTFSKSDPLLIISRPTSRGFLRVKITESIQNNHNPEWAPFMINLDELCAGDNSTKLRFHIYDDDGKKGFDHDDDPLGEGFFSLQDLENAFQLRSNLALYRMKNKDKPAGSLTVRSFKMNLSNQQAPGNPYSGQSYSSPGYPGGQPMPNQGGYPESGQSMPGHGYPGGQPMPSQGYPSGQPMLNPGGYPGPQPMPGHVYPGGQPMQGQGYPGGQQMPSQGGYPSGGHPMPGQGYPGGHPMPGQGVYPQMGGYPSGMQAPMMGAPGNAPYPPQNNPYMPSGSYPSQGPGGNIGFRMP